MQLRHAGVDQHARIRMVDDVHVDWHPLALDVQIGNEDWSRVTAWPRFGIFTISVTRGLRLCGFLRFRAVWAWLWAYLAWRTQIPRSIRCT
jgi:hypothetical protein